jgi:hypothetical protein
MRGPFCVATVFTGAGRPRGRNRAAALAAPAPASAVHPDIANQICWANNGGIRNWVHLYYPGNDHSAECLHGASYRRANATNASFCPGNNGFVSGSINGKLAPFSFLASQGRHPVSVYDDHPGTGNLHVSAISIGNWSGGAKCG